MDTFTSRDLRNLLEIDSWPCLTLLLPTEAGGVVAKQGPIRLKNMIARAERELLARGQRMPEVTQMLAPVRKLIESDEYWKQTSDGVALVVTATEMRGWRVPLRLRESLFIGRRACVKPLVPLAAPPQNFYLLAVSQKGARMLVGDQWQMTPLTMEPAQARAWEAINRDPPGSAFETDDGGVMSANPNDAHKNELLAWFRKIDHAAHEVLRNEHAPLVFAGVEYLYPIYGKANSYGRLFPEPLGGNPDHASTAELHRKAVMLLAPVLTHEQEADRKRFERHLGSRLVSASIEDILAAAWEGRVEALFVDRDHEVWGRFDAEQEKVELLNAARHDEVPQTAPMNGSEDLLDRAAFETLRHRGRGYAVHASDVPGGIALAALYRYESPVLAAAAPT